MESVFIDIETGGLELTHPIIQIAAVAVDGDWQEVDTFERKIQFDEAKCDEEALVVNHYDPVAWAEQAVEESEAAIEFNRFCAKHSRMELISKAGRPYRMAQLAGHNILTFDIPRLKLLMERSGVSFWKGCWWYPLDTYQLALWHWAKPWNGPKPENYQLGTVARCLGVEVDLFHEAMADVRTCIGVAKKVFWLEDGIHHLPGDRTQIRDSDSVLAQDDDMEVEDDLQS